MATTDNQVVSAQEPRGRVSYPCDAVKIPGGTIVFNERTSGTAEGRATNACDSGTNDFAGIAVDEADNSAGSIDDINVECFTRGMFDLPVALASKDIVGDLAYATDNWTVTPSSSSATKIGAFTEYINSTTMRVAIDIIQT